MQFLWKYIDDLIGKGLDIYLIFELLLYASCTLVPIALPLAVLLSSIMTLGNLSEKSEFIALKSSGISFFQITKPLFFFVSIVVVFSFFFSNRIIPYVNLKNTNLMYDIIHKKLAFSLEERVFFNEIDGYSLKVDKKIDDNNFSHIIILDHTGKSVQKTFIAEKANMKMGENENYLNIHLFNGNSYSDTDCFEENKSNCQIISKFDLFSLKLDLSSFKLSRGSSDRFSNKAKTMNIGQLKTIIDSIQKNITLQKNDFEKKFSLQNINHSLKLKNNLRTNNIEVNNEIITKKVLSNTKNKIYALNNLNRELKRKKQYLNKLKVELNKKYTYSFACMIMFLIGVPLGGIIKKGGFGLPVIISIFSFLIYHIISITGEKLVKKDVLEVSYGMWGPIFLFFTLGILLFISMQKEKL
tara:strand:+ start:1978 stop:3213 length:1236 start_codon:yes stop_codon:yes gene_type:complete